MTNPRNRPDGPSPDRDGHTLSAGVEYDADGRLFGYHVARRRPGERPTSRPDVWTFVPAFYTTAFGQTRPAMLHVVDPMRVDQSRGVSDYAVAIEALSQVTGYGQSELDAAVRASFGAVFLEFEDLAPHQYDGSVEVSGERDVNKAPFTHWEELRAGLHQLPAGVKQTTPTPGRPNEAFADFMDVWMTIIAATTGQSIEMVLGKFQTSYTAAQAAIQKVWATVLEKREVLRWGLSEPVKEAFLDEAVGTGKVLARGYFTDPMARLAWSGARWRAPPKPVIREDIQVEAAVKRMEAELTSRSDEVAQLTGRDRKAVDDERRSEGAAVEPVSP